MFRVLVVDNEPYVADWIASLVEMKSRREVDVCRAYTVKEAIGWLVKARIDVLVSDIRMPGMDGLELAEMVKEQWPYAKVVLVTAFAEFDYAVEAIRNNVVGYVLKNQGDDVILGEIERALGIVDTELKRKEQQRAEDIRPALPALRSKMLREILENDDFDQRMEAQLPSVGIDWDGDTPLHIMLSSLDSVDGATEGILEQYLARQDMIQQMEQNLGDCYSIYPVEISDRRMVWILRLKRHSSLQVQEPALIQGRIEMLQEAMKPGCSFVLYQEEVFLRDLQEAYLKLEKVMNSMPSSAESFFILDPAKVKREKRDMEATSRRIRMWLEEGKSDVLLEALREECRLVERHLLEQRECYNLYYTVAIQLNSYLEKQELPETESIAQLKSQLFYPPTQEDWAGKFQMLQRLAAETFLLEKKVKSRITQNTVEELKAYIKEHVCEDISLTRFSELTGYSTQYLSRIFRMQMGKTLTEYIGQKKMEKISELMHDTKLNINDIAVKSGFQTRTYFNRFIKKWTGKSPKDYRAELLLEERK